MFQLCRMLASVAILSLVSSCKPGPADQAGLPAKRTLLVDEVDVFIGTGGSGFGQGSAFPGAAMPYGLVKLSPDTHTLTPGGVYNRVAYAHFGGYWYADTRLEGFSHLHLHGTGAIDYGAVTLMPTDGMSDAKISYTGYSAAFTHSQEIAGPGYYAVTLDNGIQAELSATLHTGLHRYTFPKGAKPVVIIDAGHVLESVNVLASEVEVIPSENRVRGSLVDAGGFTSRFGGLTIYFDAAFDRSWKTHGVWADGRLSPGAMTAAATAPTNTRSSGTYLEFAGGEPVEAAVGISINSAEHARQNRLLETAGKSFDELTIAAIVSWGEVLDRIEVTGGTPNQRVQFYTALYHAFQMPTLYSDSDGGFRNELNALTHARKGRFYSDMSLWDTYRTLHPLINLIAPGYAQEFLVSLAQMAIARGSLPRWPMATGDGNSMVGTPADIVIADGYLKGYRGFDIEKVYAIMVSTATWGDPYHMRADLADYITLGYCPTPPVNGSVAVSLEEMYADFAIAQLAAALGHREDAKRFAARAKGYQKLWDSGTQFFRGRGTDGSLAAQSFTPTDFSEDYVEGNAWQYVWFVPWDAEGLAALFGGSDQLFERLDYFFAMSMQTPPAQAGGIRLFDKYYWHGNEPDIHAAYLYTLLRRPDKAAPAIRWIQRTKYSATPEGLDGNDDGGTLSAWYVWSAIGLYPLPAETRYLVGSPLFPKTVLNLRPGVTFTIRAPGASDEGMYVQSASLNGKPLSVPWIEHAEMVKGGVLVLNMGKSPSAWGQEP